MRTKTLGKGNKFLEESKKIIERIENFKTPFIYLFLAFFSSVSLRNFLEMFSTGVKNQYSLLIFLA